jgi:serine/threonine protein phosphatase PrpC
MEVSFSYSHLGREVAEFAARHLYQDLLSDPSYAEGKYEEALKAAFLNIDKRLSEPAGREEVIKIASEFTQEDVGSPKKQGLPAGTEGPDLKGCTANVLLIKNGIVYVANAGDSRAVLSKGKLAIELSADHKPDMENEKRRIIKAGGVVEDGRVEGNLNLSRALGDLHYKTNKTLKPEEQMISAEPEIKALKIEKTFEFIVMGCDGIYESKTSQEMVNFFRKELETNKGDIKLSIEKLLDTSCSHDYMKTEGLGCDNMTCILIRFNH